MMKKKIISMVLVLTMASNPFVGLAPFYVAMDKGFFKDCGLDFSMVDFDDSSASCSALLAGKVDLAYTTLDAAIIAESQYDEDMLDVTAIVDESAGADGLSGVRGTARRPDPDGGGRRHFPGRGKAAGKSVRA